MRTMGEMVRRYQLARWQLKIYFLNFFSDKVSRCHGKTEAGCWAWSK